MTALGGREVFRVLLEHHVRFLVVGGLAVNVHGLARMTLDIDLVVDLEPANIASAFRALATAGYQPTVPVSASEFADAAVRDAWVQGKHMRVLRFHSDTYPATPVDIFAFEPFVFGEEYARALVREVSGAGGVRVVALDTLMTMKQAAGRPQDLADLDNLRLRSERRG